MSGNRRLPLRLLALALLPAACGGPVQQPTSPSGVAPAHGFTATATGPWDLTSPVADLQVIGRPSSVLYVALTVSPSVCGPARVNINGVMHLVDHEVPVSTAVRTGASGSAHVAVTTTSPPCATPADAPARYASVSAPATAVLGPGAAPWALPQTGFDRPQTDAVGNSWWLTARHGSVALHGRPGSRVSLEVALTPPSCGPAVVSLGTTALPVPAAFWTDVTVPLDSHGLAELPVDAISAPCAAGGRSDYVQLRFVATQLR